MKAKILQKNFLVKILHLKISLFGFVCIKMLFFHYFDSFKKVLKIILYMSKTYIVKLDINKNIKTT